MRHTKAKIKAGKKTRKKMRGGSLRNPIRSPISIPIKRDGTNNGPKSKKSKGMEGSIAGTAFNPFGRISSLNPQAPGKSSISLAEVLKQKTPQSSASSQAQTAQAQASSAQTQSQTSRAQSSSAQAAEQDQRPETYTLPYLSRQDPRVEAAYQHLRTGQFYNSEEYMKAMWLIVDSSKLSREQFNCMKNIVNTLFNLEIRSLPNSGPGQKGGIARLDRMHFQELDAADMAENTLPCSREIARYITGKKKVKIHKPTQSQKTTFLADEVVTTDSEGNPITIIDWVETEVDEGGYIGLHCVQVKTIGLFLDFLEKSTDSKRCKRYIRLMNENITVLPGTARVNRLHEFFSRKGNGLSYLMIVTRLHNLEYENPGLLKCICDTIENHGDMCLKSIVVLDGLLGEGVEDVVQENYSRGEGGGGGGSLMSLIKIGDKTFDKLELAISTLCGSTKLVSTLDATPYRAILMRFLSREKEYDSGLLDSTLVITTQLERRYPEAYGHIRNIRLFPSIHFTDYSGPNPYKPMSGRPANSLPYYYRDKGRAVVSVLVEDDRIAEQIKQIRKETITAKHRETLIKRMDKLDKGSTMVEAFPILEGFKREFRWVTKRLNLQAVREKLFITGFNTNSNFESNSNMEPSPEIILSVKILNSLGANNGSFNPKEQGRYVNERFLIGDKVSAITMPTEQSPYLKYTQEGVTVVFFNGTYQKHSTIDADTIKQALNEYNQDVVFSLSTEDKMSGDYNLDELAKSIEKNHRNNRYQFKICLLNATFEFTKQRKGR